MNNVDNTNEGVFWYENDGNQVTRRLIGALMMPRLATADIDGDGDWDVWPPPTGWY